MVGFAVADDTFRDLLVGVVTSWCDPDGTGSTIRNDVYKRLPEGWYNLNSDSVDFTLLAPYSALRRVIGWGVDGALLMGIRIGLSGFPKVVVIPLLATLWITRDVVGTAYGMQSPGRTLMGQRVLSLDGPTHEVWSTIKLNSAYLLFMQVLIPGGWKLMHVVTASKGNIARGAFILGAVPLFGATLYFAIAPMIQLWSGDGRLWMDEFARTQVVNWSSSPSSFTNKSIASASYSNKPTDPQDWPQDQDQEPGFSRLDQDQELAFGRLKDNNTRAF